MDLDLDLDSAIAGLDTSLPMVIQYSNLIFNALSHYYVPEEQRDKIKLLSCIT